MEPVSEHAVSPNLDLHLKRTSMDRFRVALSRATEALIFLDVGVGDEERAPSAAGCLALPCGAVRTTWSRS